MRFSRQSNGQIKALKTFTLYDGRTITAGTLGGTIASPRSLSQSGTAWVFPNGKIEGNAFVSGNALVATGGEVLGNAKVYGNATIGNNGTVTGEARVLGNASVIGNATKKSTVSGEAFVYGDSRITNGGQISGKARVQGEAIAQHSGITSYGAIVADGRVAIYLGISQNFSAGGNECVPRYKSVAFDLAAWENPGCSRLGKATGRCDGSAESTCGNRATVIESESLQCLDLTV
jgi:hypothetical protein